MDKLELIYSLVTKVLADGDAVLKGLKEERPDEDTVTFYDISLDAEGMPYSHGNSNDVYDDGYSNGVTQGEYDLASKILLILHGETDVK
jgi:hypothetical protein